MSNAELCYLTATEALKRFRERTLSPVELMQATLARIEAVGDPINAFSFERAIAWIDAISSSVGVRPVPIAQRGS